MKFISELDQLREDPNVTITRIDSRGIEIKDENLAAAKSVSIAGNVKYFARSSKRQRRLYNPIVDKIDQRSVIRTELEFDMSEINKECFDSYCEYLKTRNSYMLTKADLFSKR